MTITPRYGRRKTYLRHDQNPQSQAGRARYVLLGPRAFGSSLYIFCDIRGTAYPTNSIIASPYTQFRYCDEQAIKEHKTRVTKSNHETPIQTGNKGANGRKHAHLYPLIPGHVLDAHRHTARCVMQCSRTQRRETALTGSLPTERADTESA